MTVSPKAEFPYLHKRQEQRELSHSPYPSSWPGGADFNKRLIIILFAKPVKQLKQLGISVVGLSYGYQIISRGLLKAIACRQCRVPQWRWRRALSTFGMFPLGVTRFASPPAPRGCVVACDPNSGHRHLGFPLHRGLLHPHCFLRLTQHLLTHSQFGSLMTITISISEWRIPNHLCNTYILNPSVSSVSFLLASHRKLIL